MTENQPSSESRAERDILWELAKLDSACNMTPLCQSPYDARDCYKRRHAETSPPSDSDLRCDCPCHNALLIDNLPFYPAIQDPDPWDVEKVKIALSVLKRSQPQAWEEIEEALSAGNEKRARKLLERYHSRLHRSMRPVMWEKLFELVTPLSDRERIGRILRKHAKTFRTLQTDEIARKNALAELDTTNIPFLKDRRGRPRAAKWSDLKPNTALYRAVMGTHGTLHRYYSGYKTKAATRDKSIPKKIRKQKAASR